MSPPSDKLDSPVLAFISLERYNAVRLVQAVHSSLADLNKVLRGSALLTTDVQRLARALLRHEVRLTVITGLEWWWVRGSRGECTSLKFVCAWLYRSSIALNFSACCCASKHILFILLKLYTASVS